MTFFKILVLPALLLQGCMTTSTNDERRYASENRQHMYDNFVVLTAKARYLQKKCPHLGLNMSGMQNSLRGLSVSMDELAQLRKNSDANIVVQSINAYEAQKGLSYASSVSQFCDVGKMEIQNGTDVGNILIWKK